MDIAQRIKDIHALLAPMVQRGLITVAQEENCERMLLNLADSVGKDGAPGTRHHQYYTHAVLVEAIFNGCSQAAKDHAMGLNVERVAFDLEPDVIRPDECGGAA